MLTSLSYSSISKVLESWEFARQIQGSEENIGMGILLRMFEYDQRVKEVFGFARNTDFSKGGMAKMGLMVHGLRMVRMIDATLSSMLGPAIDDIDNEMLASLARRHLQIGVRVQYVALL